MIKCILKSRIDVYKYEYFIPALIKDSVGYETTINNAYFGGF